jgi:hypothetical protein
MTIKEYLKDHSERELVKKIHKIYGDMHFITVDINRMITYLKEDGIEIEEEDYLAKAREFGDKCISKLQTHTNKNIKNISATLVQDNIIILRGYYEKAYKQLQEKK